MSSIEHLFQVLNDPRSTSEKCRTDLGSWLKQQASIVNLESAVDFGYTVAGFMATDWCRSLGENDPIDNILTIASELEIRPSNTDDLFQELVLAIEHL